MRENDGWLHVDNTMLCDFAKCTVAGIARHGLGLRGRAEKMEAEVGSAFHVALEQHFRGDGVEEVVGTLRREMDVIEERNGGGGEERFRWENIEKVMRAWIERRPIGSFPFTPVSFEQTLGAVLSERDQVMFHGKIDLRVEDWATKSIVPLDHKTTGRITSYWTKKFQLASQLSGYCWLEDQVGGGSVGRCGTCYVNAIEVSLLPNSGKKCPKHRVPYSECGSDHLVSELLMFSRSPEQMNAWKQDAIGIAKRARVMMQGFGAVELLKYAPRDGAFTDGCMWCEFRDWCRMGWNEDAQEAFVVEERWEPWNEEGARVL